MTVDNGGEQGYLFCILDLDLKYFPLSCNPLSIMQAEVTGASQLSSCVTQMGIRDDTITMLSDSQAALNVLDVVRFVVQSRMTVREALSQKNRAILSRLPGKRSGSSWC